MVFQMSDPRQVETLIRWLIWSDVLLGWNTAFDVLVLRALPAFRRILNGRHILIDGAITNYLELEVRPERSLKDVTFILGTGEYERTLRDGRFDSPLHRQHIGYNGRDTIFALRNVAALCRAILEHHPATDKLSNYCLWHYSNCLWDCIRKSEAGLPMDTTYLRRLERRNQLVAEYADSVCRSRHKLMLGNRPGESGCKATQAHFVERLMAAYDDMGIISDGTTNHVGRALLLDHPLLQRSDILHDISWTKPNRLLFRHYLPDTHPLRLPLKLADRRTDAASCASNLSPLLRRRMTKAGKPYKDPKKVFSDILLPQTLPASSPVYLGYPSWFIVPSHVKDDGGDEGGQIQARPSCTSPGALKFHPAIRQAYKSRWVGGVIIKWDQSQHELRTAAMLSGDPFLCHAYTSDPPIDLHTDRAIQIFGPDIPNHPLFKLVHRQAGKHANFTDLNRGGAKLLLNTIFKKSGGVIVPLSMCEDIVRSRRRQRPGLMAWQDKMIRYAKKHRYIELPFTGHSRYFIPGAKHEDSAIVNFPVQAIAANTVWAIEHLLCTEHLPNISDPDPDCYIFLNHYDALFIDCKTPEVANRIVESLEYCMREVEQHGYWSWWCDLTGNFIPLVGDWNLIYGPAT
jgi:hypothetical protein